MSILLKHDWNVSVVRTVTLALVAEGLSVVQSVLPWDFAAAEMGRLTGRLESVASSDVTRSWGKADSFTRIMRQGYRKQTNLHTWFLRREQ